MKYRIVDADNRAEYSKPETFEEVKAWFEPNAEFEEEHIFVTGFYFIYN